jgi:hypothetical protein
VALDVTCQPFSAISKMKSIIRFVNGFFALFLRIGYISLMMTIAFFIQNPAIAQEPLLLESIEQSFNYTKDTFETEATTTYAYDHHGRMINKTRKGPELCMDCTDYMQEELDTEIQNWTYNNFGWETYYSYVMKWWRKNEPQNPWKLQTTRIETRNTTYNEDTLVIEKIVRTEYPATDWQSSQTYTVTETFQYNNSRQKTQHMTLNETTSNSYVSSELQKWDYTYENNLLTIESYSIRYLSNGEPTGFTNTTITNSYNSDRQLQSKETDYDYNGSRYKYRQVFLYNSTGQLIREEGYYFNTNINDWSLTMGSNYEYYGTGVLKKVINTTITDGDNYTITTTDYNEAGKQIFSKQELFDDQMVFIRENYHTITEWLNDKSSRTTGFSVDGIYSYLNLTELDASGKLLLFRYETQNYTPDSAFLQSALYQTIYEYDNGGDLFRTRETRIDYDADSLIMSGCCGFQYEAETLFASRCDGVLASKIRRQNNYITGTEGDMQPNPIFTREFYKYTPSLCDLEENEKISISVFPNPSVGSVNIASDLLALQNTRLLLVTADGKMVSVMTTPVTTTMNLDMTGIAPGLYILRLENGDLHATERIVLNQ